MTATRAVSRDSILSLPKEHIARLLDELIEGYEVWAPVRQDRILSPSKDEADGSSPVVFDRISAGREAALDVVGSTMSAKAAFFPRTETMFLYDGTQVEEPVLWEGERVLFGVRPCDAASFLMLGRVFDTPEYPSVYYGDRRERTTVVGIACSHPLNTCFCSSVGSGPGDDEGMDVLLSDVGAKYVVEAITDKGRKLLEGISLLDEATPADLHQKERRAQEAVERMRSGVAIEGLKERLDDMFDDPLWEAVARKCLGCGACTYVCPTCHCFDIVDEGEGGRGRRVRIWDSCQYPLFTHHTSGHNPRPSGMGRMRQRVMHKFHYLPGNVEMVGCVGCGRCIRSCPVNLDIRQVLRLIMEV